MAVIEETTDAPTLLNSNYTLTVGDSFEGGLGTNDIDVVAIDLVQGHSYTFDLTAQSHGNGAMSDPYLTVFADNGDILLENDDVETGVNLSSSITFTANYTGTFYLELSSSDMINNGSSSDIGDYVLTTQSNGVAPPLPTYTYEQIADYILTTGWDRTTPIGYNIDVGDSSTSNDSIKVNITKLTADGQFLATKALEAWTMVSGIQFDFVSSGEQLDFDDNQSGAFAGWSSLGSYITSSYVNVSTGWLNNNGTTIGSYSFQTYMHEIGHALGIAHAGPYDGNATFGIDNAYANDSWQASIMSYFSQTENTNIDADYAVAVTPMIADIIAIKELYGDAGDLRIGDTIYGVGSTAGGYYDDLNSITSAFTFTVFDDGGTDTINFSDATDNQTVDLNARAVSDVYGLTGNMVIADGTVIENFISGSGNDIIVGNSSDNNLTGGLGNDELSGGAGADALIGGSGIDEARYASSSQAIGADLITENNNIARFGPFPTTDASGDTFSSIENIFGSQYDDYLRGDHGSNKLTGWNGNDFLAGRDGDDALWGSNGNDIMWGGRGEDELIGGAGFDEARYTDSTAGLTVDLLTGNNTWIAKGDVFTSIENLFGSVNDDILRGDNGRNKLTGFYGDDTLFGRGGDDVILGSDGNDVIYGGSGNDIFFFRVGDDTDVIKDFEAASADQISLALYTGIENFADLSGSINQDGADVRITLTGGDEIILENQSVADIGSDDFLF